MSRCKSCDGIIAKHETVCFKCGDPIPGRASTFGNVIAFCMAIVIAVCGCTLLLHL